MIAALSITEKATSTAWIYGCGQMARTARS